MTKCTTELEKVLVDEFGYNPLFALRSGEGNSVPEKAYLFEDALKALNKHGVELLVPLLESENRNTVLNALHVFSELGKKGKQLLAYVMPHMELNDESASWYVVDGLIPYIREVPIENIAICLMIANDDSERLRIKAVDLIASLPTPLLEKVVGLIDAETEQHENGLALLSEDYEIDSFLTEYSNLNKVSSCYFLANIIKRAKVGVFTDMNEVNESESLPFYVKQKLELLKKRKAKHVKR